MEKPKIYDIVVNYDDETGIESNSAVQSPAVEIERIAFSEDKLMYDSDDSQQKFIGVSILADTPIKRINKKTGEIFYTRFTKENIRIMVNKFIKEGRNNNMTYNHTDKVIKNIYLVENFFQEKGRVETTLFKDIPDGSWITTYWVEDKEQYNMLKNDPKFKGFSIEINVKLQEMFSKIDEMIIDYESGFDKVKEILNSKSLTDDEIWNELKKTLDKNI
jgi:hypothetical protein